MKRFLYIICFVAVICSCKKSQAPSPQGMFGRWELRQSVGGIAGINTKYPAGNGSILQLNGDSTYNSYNHNSLLTKGTFQIRKNGINIGTSKFDGIYFDRNSFGQAIELKGDTLTIGIDYDDEIASIYLRKN